jgi:NAD(P)H-hydrate epimerase
LSITTQQIATFFQEAGRAHHQAYIETDGADAEWPLWYAQYMQVRLSQLLQQDFTQSELVYWLVKLNKEYTAVSPTTPWPQWYAQVLADAFL